MKCKGSHEHGLTLTYNGINVPDGLLDIFSILRWSEWQTIQSDHTLLCRCYKISKKVYLLRANENKEKK